jgi:hypothetical protein
MCEPSNVGMSAYEHTYLGTHVHRGLVTLYCAAHLRLSLSSGRLVALSPRRPVLFAFHCSQASALLFI